MTEFLIVEDEAIVAFDIRMQLQQLGFSACGVAASARDALELWERHRPTHLIMDIYLRGEVNGLELAEELIRRGVSPCNLLFISALCDVKGFDLMERLGIHNFLKKPFYSADLSDCIERMTGCLETSDLKS